jgi:hypothetical protein
MNPITFWTVAVSFALIGAILHDWYTRGPSRTAERDDERAGRAP